MSRVSPAPSRARWSILGSPLILGNDLTAMDKDCLDIVLNAEVIALNQDPLVSRGKLVFQWPDAHWPNSTSSTTRKKVRVLVAKLLLANVWFWLREAPSVWLVCRPDATRGAAAAAAAAVAAAVAAIAQARAQAEAGWESSCRWCWRSPCLLSHWSCLSAISLPSLAAVAVAVAAVLV